MGSQAYGLATPSSDIDKLGIFVRPTEDFWGLDTHRESYTHDEDDTDDYCYHEARKYIKLALKCNPTALELLYLDHEFYTVQTSFSERLIHNRHAFLSASYVRHAYLGYVTSQVHRIKSNPDSPRVAKHARHIWRLCQQGLELWMREHMSVKLERHDAELCRFFGEEVAEGNMAILEARINSTEALFDAYQTRLPDEPDSASVETWLLNLRRQMLVPEKGLNYG